MVLSTHSAVSLPLKYLQRNVSLYVGIYDSDLTQPHVKLQPVISINDIKPTFTHPHVTKMAVVCLADLAKIAKKKLDRNAYNYFSSGADKEQTLRDNEEAFRRCLSADIHPGSRKVFGTVSAIS